VSDEDKSSWGYYSDEDPACSPHHSDDDAFFSVPWGIEYSEYYPELISTLVDASLTNPHSLQKE